MSEPESAPSAEAATEPENAAPASRVQRLRSLMGGAAFRRMANPFGVFGEMAVALFGPDAPSRRMALLFFLSLGMLGLAIGLAYERYMRLQSLKTLYSSESFEKTSKNLGEFIQKQAETAKHRFSTLPLGRFSVELRGDSADNFRSAEIEIVLELDNKETRYFIEDNMPKLRDQVTNVLLPLDRDELMTADGKKRLKKKLLDRINSWLPQGRVVELFFSDLILN